MGGFAKKYRFENKGVKYTRRCDKCHAARTELYHVQFEEGGPFYWVCPLNCFRQAQANYIVNKAKGILPTAPDKGFEEPEDEVIVTSREGEAAIGEAGE